MPCMTCLNIATVRGRWKCIPSVVGAVPRLEVGTSKTLGKRLLQNVLILRICTSLSRFRNITLKFLHLTPPRLQSEDTALNTLNDSLFAFFLPFATLDILRKSTTARVRAPCGTLGTPSRGPAEAWAKLLGITGPCATLCGACARGLVSARSRRYSSRGLGPRSTARARGASAAACARGACGGSARRSRADSARTGLAPCTVAQMTTCRQPALAARASSASPRSARPLMGGANRHDGSNLTFPGIRVYGAY